MHRALDVLDLKRARRRALWVMGGNVAYALSQLCILVVLAKWSSLEELGHYAVALAITAPVQIGLGMRLRTARVVTDPAEHSLSTFYQLAILTGLGAVLVSLVSGLWVTADSTAYAVVVVVAASKAVEGVVELGYGELQRVDRMALVGVLQASRAALTAIVAFIVVFLGYGALGTAVGILVAWTALLAASDAVVLRRFRAHSKHGGSRSPTKAAWILAKEVWPLGLGASLNSFVSAAPRLIAATLLGPAQVGILALLTYPATVIALVANSAGQAQLPALREGHVSGDKRMVRQLQSRLYGVITVVGLTGVLALVLLGEPLLRPLIPGFDDETLAVGIVLMLAATCGGYSTVAYFLLTSKGMFVRHPFISGIVAALGLPLVYALGDLWGLLGLAVGVLGLQLIKWLTTLVAAGGARGDGPPNEPNSRWQQLS